MKKILITSIALLSMLTLAINSFAQASKEPVIKWTEKQNMAKGIAGSITHLSTGKDAFIFFYEVVNAPSYSFFVKMDMLTGKAQNQRLELKDDGVKRQCRHVRELNDKIYIFSSFQNKKDKRHYIFAETLNKEMLKLNNDARKVGEISYKDVKGDELSNFAVTLSPNKEKVLLSYVIVDLVEVTRLGIQVLDKNLNPIWTRESDFVRIEGKDIYPGDYMVDNEGNVYMSQNIYDKKKKTWSLYITCFPSDNSDQRIKEVKFSGDKYASTETFICNANGEVICSGLYSESGKLSVSGAFSFLYSPRLGTVLSSSEKEFDERFITMGMQYKDAEKIIEKKEDGKEFDEGFKYNFKDKFYRKDGGYSLIAEKYKLQVYSVKRANMSVSDYYHSYNDVIILTFNADGSIRWVQKIPKSQRLLNTSNLHGSYYATIDDDDTIHLLYNENTRNKISEKSQPLMVNVDKEGEVSFIELFKKDKNVHESFAPALSRKLSGKKYLLARIHPYGFAAFNTSMSWGITDLE